MPFKRIKINFTEKQVMYLYVVLSTITVIIATHYFLKLRKRKPSTHQIYKNEIENNVPEILESSEESSYLEQNLVQSEIYCTSTNDFERKNLLRKKLYSQFHYLLLSCLKYSFDEFFGNHSFIALFSHF